MRLTRRQVGEALRLSQTATNTLLASQEIPGYRDSHGYWRIPVRALTQYLAKHPAKLAYALAYIEAKQLELLAKRTRR